MNKIVFSLTFFVVLMITESQVFAQKSELINIDWQLIAKVQNANKQPSIGFAGPINGVHNDVFLTAGGANFPDKMPWEGGKKIYSNEIHILSKKDGKFEWSSEISTKLPEAIAYAGNVSTDKGVVYVGGENEKGLSKSTYLLQWNTENKNVQITKLADLPLALTNVAVAHIDNKVYAIGGDAASHSSNTVFELDLDLENANWNRLADLPIALANSTAISQFGADGNMQIFVIGGRSKTKSGISDLHSTVFAYTPKTNHWKSKAPIFNGKNISNLSAASGVAINNSLILITGGDNGLVFHQIETFISKIAGAENAEEKQKFTQAKNDLVIHHQGFDKSLLLYNTLSDTWQKIGELPFLAPVTTTATKWEDNIVLSNGEIKPGIRTPNVMLGIVR